MPNLPTPLGHEEYRALRATIRERGTARVVIAAFTFVVWATLSIVTQAILATPVACLVPLVVLLAGFEIIFSLHVGVERIGRYLQVRFEGTESADPAWETTVMRVGAPAGSPAFGLDPLFTGLFVLATILNMAPAAIQSFDTGPSFMGFPVELMVLGLIHVAVILRLFQARRFSALQRQSDLDLFKRADTRRP